MDVLLSNGTSTRKLRQSSHTGKKVGLGTLEDLEEDQLCKLGTPTQDGGKYSSMTLSKRSSTMLETNRESLMSKEAEMKKVKMFKSGRRTVQMLRNGPSFMMTRKPRTKLEVRTKILVSQSTDLSTSDQECQCKELLNAGEQTTSSSLTG